MSSWIFGYGSLVWRPDLPYSEARWGWIEGWERRFWQGSPDHRGQPDDPGRVLTLIQRRNARCWGRVYQIDPAQEEAVMKKLNHREKAGYDLIDVAVETKAGIVLAKTYVGNATNPHFLGPAPLRDMLSQIRRCHGPSGSNKDYVLELAKALREVETPSEEPELFVLATALGAT